jgi:hypothetical protein
MNTLDSRFLQLGNCFGHRFSGSATFGYSLSGCGAANSKLRPPLSLRKPERSFLVLLTPALMQIGRAGDAISKSRLYGWLMPAYRDPNSLLLRQHPPPPRRPRIGPSC